VWRSIIIVTARVNETLLECRYQGRSWNTSYEEFRWFIFIAVAKKIFFLDVREDGEKSINGGCFENTSDVRN